MTRPLKAVHVSVGCVGGAYLACVVDELGQVWIFDPIDSHGWIKLPELPETITVEETI